MPYRKAGKPRLGAVVYRCFTGCVPPGEIGIMWYADIEPTMYKTTINIEDVMESFHLAKYRIGRKLSWDAEWRIDQASADIMNAKDGTTSGGRLWERGDTCHRFNTRDAALKAGLDLAKRIWGPGKKVLIGDEYESEPERVTLE